MTAQRRTRRFDLATGTTLVLDGITAQVRIGVGERDRLAVQVEAGPAYQDRLRVVRDEVRFTLRELPPQSPEPLLGSPGRPVDGPRNRSAAGTGSQEAQDPGSRIEGVDVSDIVTADGNREDFFGIIRDRIIAGDEDITDRIRGRVWRETAGRTGLIRIAVPAATPLHLDGCRWVDVDRVGGILRAVSEGSTRLRACDVLDPEVTVTGESAVTVTEVAGTALLSVSGWADVELDGSLGLLQVAVSDQARVTARGTFGGVGGAADGRGRIELEGGIERFAVDTFGTATLIVNGRKMG